MRRRRARGGQRRADWPQLRLPLARVAVRRKKRRTALPLRLLLRIAAWQRKKTAWPMRPPLRVVARMKQLAPHLQLKKPRGHLLPRTPPASAPLSRASSSFAPPREMPQLRAPLLLRLALRKPTPLARLLICTQPR